MISTGAFLDEMTASNKQPNLAEKFAAVWEKKNAKAARAGGVSLMALSLAACGGSSDTAATDTPADDAATPVEPTTPVVPTTPTVNAITLDGTETTVAGTAGADKISGVVSALTSADTVNEKAVITGGEGDDTLALSMSTNFAGFTADVGSMSGVETVELTNTSSASRQFDASGISGVTTYVVDGTNGAVTLIDVADLAALSVKSLASGAVSITFDTATVKGTADTWSVDVNGVGTANSAAATAAANTKYVDITATGVETLELASNGAPAAASAADAAANYVSLAGTSGAKTITVTGSNAIDIEDVSAAVTSFDASEVSGNVTVDLTAAAADALTSVKTGAGADSVTVTPTDMPLNGAIDLGAGEDTLVLSGATDTVSQYVIKGVETLDVTLATGTASVDLAKSEIPATYVIAEGENNSNAYTGVITFVGDSGAKEIDIVGAHSNTSAKIDTDTTGAVTLDMDPTSAGKATATETAATDIIADKAASFTLDMAAHSVMTGTMSADKATTVTVKTASTGQTLDLQAAKVETLDITTGGTLALAGTADIGSAQVLTVAAGKGVNLTGSSETLAKLSTATLSGSGTSSAVTLGAVGATDLSYATSITATGLKAGLTIGNIDAGTESVTLDVKGTTGTVTVSNSGALLASKSVTVEADGSQGAIDLGTVGATGDAVKNVTINAADALGGITIGNGTTANVDIFATGSITINGSNLNANGAQIDTEDTATATTVALAGGISTDNYDISTGTKQTSLTVTGDLGSGSDDLDIDIAITTAAAGQTIDVSGFVAENVNITHATGTHAKATSFVGSKSTSVTDKVTLDNGVFSKLSLTDIDLLAVDNTGAVDVNASALSGKAQAVAAVTAGDVLSLTGTDAADTIDLSKLTDGGADIVIHVEGSKGADTVTGSFAVDHFEYINADNGADSIKSFVAGSSGDVLNFGLPLGTNSAVQLQQSAADAITATAVGTAVDIDGQIALIKNAADEASEVAALFAVASNSNGYAYLDSAADGSEEAIVLTGVDDSTTIYVWNVINTSGYAIADTEVTSLGTITLSSGDIDDFVAANFTMIA